MERKELQNMQPRAVSEDTRTRNTTEKAVGKAEEIVDKDEREEEYN